jgi:O-antigen/teichoic acid export membrane protein
MPEVNRLIAVGDHAILRRLLSRTSRGLLALSIGLGALCYVAVVHFATAMLGNAFAGVAALMPWMLAGIVVSAPFVWGHPLAVALNRADLALAASLAGTLVGLGGFVLLTPTFGTAGAGIAWSMTLIVSVGGVALLSRRAWRRKMQN